MNKSRRKELKRIIDELVCLKDSMETLLEEEQSAFDNMPESLQWGESKPGWLGTITRGSKSTGRTIPE